jgi:membrane fusion protein, multidrug efflux system
MTTRVPSAECRVPTAGDCLRGDAETRGRADAAQRELQLGVPLVGSLARWFVVSPKRSLGLAVLATLLISTACGRAKQGPPPTVPVTVAKASIQPEPLSLKVVGTVEPIESVAIRAQVGGVITQITFTEGQDVKAGQLLIQIDPRPFKASLDAAQAQLAKDKAQAANAEIQAKRYEQLVAKDFVTKEQYDGARTQAEMLASSVQADEAAVEQARLNLAYAALAAPISGRTGSLLVKKGNVVKANDAPLVVINQMQPIRVSFAIPGGQLPLVQKYSAGGPLKVQVRPSRDGKDAELEGALVFVDNAVDSSTGTVTLKGEFGNGEGYLWPGQFVDTELVLAIEPKALTVPAVAVVTGQEGPFVFVVTGDAKVEKRSVKVNRTVDSTAVIDEGLREGETVVTDGQMRLVPGSVVEVKAGPASERRGES